MNFKTNLNNTLILLALVLVINLNFGCVSKQPWETYHLSAKPDYNCFIGPSEAGCDVYVWSCIENERVVIYQCGSAFLMSHATKESTQCNSITSFEKNHQINNNRLKSCQSSRREWK